MYSKVIETETVTLMSATHTVLTAKTPIPRSLYLLKDYSVTNFIWNSRLAPQWKRTSEPENALIFIHSSTYVCMYALLVFAGEARMNSQARFSNGTLHMDVALLADQQELTYNCSMRTQDVVWKTCRMQWMIGRDVARESGKFVLAAQLDHIYKYI